MSLFDLTEKDIQDYHDWMNTIRLSINQNIEDKSNFYSFNFSTSEPIGDAKYMWEKTKEPIKRLSQVMSMMRSSLSTLPTLGDELTEDIPEISNFDLRISQDFSIGPIVLSPRNVSDIIN
ncbi:hypothetical protein SteCoe_6502 [Stentor coeruleus]|uniref:Uncharacterized protein n=1 Tax=Stentor coeruleus TaxID=5963 RepID=A0A1R2CPV3_9CILI|nr:hypothetical protein SteCoe_6502 [Stentor coeruleus]